MNPKATGSEEEIMKVFCATRDGIRERVHAPDAELAAH
jgi:hypothetical protein